MDGDDASVAGGGAADHGRRPPRGRGVRAGRILGAVAVVTVWVLALGWSIGLLGAMGVAAADHFDAAVVRFDERMAASEIAFEAMEAEVVEAELALERSDGRVHDPQTRERLDAAHADAGREIDRLEDALADQVVGVESARPLPPAWLWPHLWHGAARDVDTLEPPSNADFQAEVSGAAGGRERGRPIDGRVGGRARRGARGGARRPGRSGLDDGSRGARRPDDGRVRRRDADRDLRRRRRARGVPRRRRPARLPPDGRRDRGALGVRRQRLPAMAGRDRAPQRPGLRRGIPRDGDRRVRRHRRNGSRPNCRPATTCCSRRACPRRGSSSTSDSSWSRRCPISRVRSPEGSVPVDGVHPARDVGPLVDTESDAAAGDRLAAPARRGRRCVARRRRGAGPRGSRAPRAAAAARASATRCRWAEGRCRASGVRRGPGRR